MAKALGRGLGALLPGAPSREERSTLPVELPWSSLRANAGQPRREMDPEALQSLARSLACHGLLEPILVRPVGEGYEIVAGERRWQAARLAGLEKVPVRVLDLDDDAVLEVALIENLQREDLAPLEVARALLALVEKAKGQEEAARKLGWHRSTVANKLRLLHLPEAIQAMMDRKELTEGHGRALLAVTDDGTRLALAESCRDEGWSVRDLEAAVRLAAAREAGPRERGRSGGSRLDLPGVARLRERFGLDLTVVARGERRSLRIDGLDETALEGFLAFLEREGERLFPGK